MNKQNKI